jgi:hypothetical protein
MSKQVQFMQFADKTSMPCSYCRVGYATWDYQGLCPSCWAALTPVNRAVLRGEEPPVDRIVIQERIIPAVPTWRKVAVGLWRVIMTGAAALIMWRTIR